MCGAYVHMFGNGFQRHFIEVFLNVFQSKGNNKNVFVLKAFSNFPCAFQALDENG